VRSLLVDHHETSRDPYSLQPLREEQVGVFVFSQGLVDWDMADDRGDGGRGPSSTR
jgi:hypothetical protein